MGIVRDITVEELKQAVNNIDTSTLAQDSTLQDVVTAIGNISGGNDPVTNTTVNSLCKDTTGQSIASAISGLGATLGANKADIDGANIANPSAFRSAIGISAAYTPYSNTSSGLTANNVQGAIDEVCYNLIQTKTYTASYTVGVSASVAITANDFNVSTPNGYTPIGIVDFASQNANVTVRGIYSRATGTSTIMALRNVSSSSISATAYVTILYIKSLFL